MNEFTFETAMICIFAVQCPYLALKHNYLVVYAADCGVCVWAKILSGRGVERLANGQTKSLGPNIHCPFLARGFQGRQVIYHTVVLRDFVIHDL